MLYYYYIVLFLSSFILSQRQGGGCSSHYLRREVRELNENELRELHQAFNQMKSEGVWDSFCRTHLDNVPFAHSTPYFLPWHREFIYQFELELRRINPRVTLPYWDWSLDSQAPERSAIFSSEYFGGMGGRCVDDGPYSHWVGRYPDRHCLFRSFDGGDTIGAFTSSEVLRQRLGNANDFNEFWNIIEGNPHGNVHNNIGGDMASMASCNDPLFYLHHGMIDKLWYDWQNLNPNNVFSFGGQAPNGNEANLDDDLTPFNKAVGQVMDIPREYCYTYSAGIRAMARSRPRERPTPRQQRNRNRRNIRRNQNNEEDCDDDTALSAQAEDSTNNKNNKNNKNNRNKYNSPGPYDRKDQYRLRYPAPLKESYIKMMKLNRTILKQEDQKLRAQTDELNESGYVSDFSLGLNGLLYFLPRELVKLGDLLIGGDTIRQLPENLANLITLHKPLINFNDLNILRNLLD